MIKIKKETTVRIGTGHHKGKDVLSAMIDVITIVKSGGEVTVVLEEEFEDLLPPAKKKED